MAKGYSSISTSEPGSMPVATSAAQMVQVVAPATLSEGTIGRKFEKAKDSTTSSRAVVGPRVLTHSMDFLPQLV
jgi:hypothetical protein